MIRPKIITTNIKINITGNNNQVLFKTFLNQFDFGGCMLFLIDLKLLLF